MKNNDTYVIHVLGLFFRSLQWLLLASYNTYNGHFDFFFYSIGRKINRMLRFSGDRMLF